MKRFEDVKHHKLPYLVQPKLDGVGFFLDADGVFYSRNGKLFPAVKEPLPRAGKHTLVGEFYCHGMPLAKIAGIVGSENGDLSKIKLYFYDALVPYATAQQRLDVVRNSVSTGEILSAEKAYTLGECDRLYEKYISLGYEGAVYKYVNGFYPGKSPPAGRDFFDHPNMGVCKRKKFIEEEYICIGVEEGKGKRAGHVGRFIVTDGKVTFAVGGGRVPYSELRRLFVNPPINKPLRVAYSDISEYGIPLCPQFVAVRDYE